LAKVEASKREAQMVVAPKLKVKSERLNSSSLDFLLEAALSAPRLEEEEEEEIKLQADTSNEVCGYKVSI
jgi:hypothetical protein